MKQAKNEKKRKNCERTRIALSSALLRGSLVRTRMEGGERLVRIASRGRLVHCCPLTYSHIRLAHISATYVSTTLPPEPFVSSFS
uniref:Uncharacterized protein n=1 Tax=Trichogramma kaykai TaxID=54128 RepID=A0ABD2WQG6_9HYME